MNPIIKYKRDGTFLKVIECILYIVLVNLSYYCALLINITNLYEIRNFEAYYNSAIMISLATLVAILLNKSLNTVRKSLAENFIIMVITALMIGIFTMAIAFFYREFALPRTAILIAFIIQVITFSLVKIFFVSYIKKTSQDKYVLLIGNKEEKEILFSKTLSNAKFNDKVRYFVIPSCNMIPSFLKRVDKVYMSDSLDRDALNRTINLCLSNHIPVYIVPKTYEIAIYNSELLFMSDIPFFKVDNIVLSWEKMIIKRMMDILLSSLGLILVAPIMLAVGLLIWVNDGKPIIFAQERVTRNNKVFKLYKFRSMINDAEKLTGAVLASEDDPRITPIGKVLRRFWLDELPQLYNVLKGDMSLVGPRPERPVFIEEFSKEIPDFKYRLAVNAGVTGYAQVMGKYTTNAENKIKLDLLYIQNCSILFDLKIIIETIKKIILGTLKRGESREFEYKELLLKHNIREKDRGDMVEYHYKIQKNLKHVMKKRKASGIA